MKTKCDSCKKILHSTEHPGDIFCKHLHWTDHVSNISDTDEYLDVWDDCKDFEPK